MNKQEFLHELRSRICILEETEQQDILSEYAQHIDLRIAGGLSEEEAIQDFGDPGELAAEILEAYHVDPSRLSASSRSGQAAQSLRRSAAGLRDRLGRLSRGITGSLGRWGCGISAWWRRSWQRLRALTHRPHPTNITDKEAAPMPPTPRSHAALSHAKQVGYGLGRLISALAHLVWNLLVVLVLLPFAAAGLLALLGIGLLVVLLVQGYPLAGPLLCGMGLVLCCAALVGLCTTLFKGRRAPAAGPRPAGPGESGKEVTVHA